MKLFKESKHQPIKFRNFKFVGYHKDYTNACYYVKGMHNSTNLKNEINKIDTYKDFEILMCNYKKELEEYECNK